MDNLKEKTAKGIAWGAVNNGSLQVLNLVFGIVLARRLSESDYGILALLTIFTALAGCIQTAGFSQALANMKPPSRRDYSAVFWFNILAGVSLYALLFLAAPLIARYFGLPQLKDLSRLVFLCIPLSALGIVPNAKLWIELRNRELAIASIVSLSVSGCVGVWMAYNGFGYWSLAWQQLLFVGLCMLFKWLFTRWCPMWPIDLSPIRPMFRFSSKMLVTNILTVVSQNVLTFIFGKLLPIGVVGQWGQANKWNTMGSAFIANTMQQVAQPVFTQASVESEASKFCNGARASSPASGPVVGEASELCSPETPSQRQERVFRKMLRFTAFISFPLMLGLALVAREFIVITIGAKWLPCVPLLQVLCVGGAFLPLHTLYQNFIISRGRSDLYLRCIALLIVLQVALTLALSPLGVMAMVMAFSALNVVFTLCWHLALSRVASLSLLSALRDIIPFLLVALVVMAATGALTLWADSSALRLALRVPLAALFYFAAMRLLHAKTLEESLTFVLGRKNS